MVAVRFGLVAVRFGLVCVVLELAGRGDQNTPYRFNLKTHPTAGRGDENTPYRF
mgnify:CR=1 FL=1